MPLVTVRAGGGGGGGHGNGGSSTVAPQILGPTDSGTSQIMGPRFNSALFWRELDIT